MLMDKIKVLIADDHEMVRLGVRSLIEEDSRIEVVGEAKDGREVVELILDKHPNVILMDINMPGVNGIATTELIKKSYSYIKVLVLSVHNEVEYIKEMVRAGASGYLMKTCSKEELLEAITTVYSGNKYFDDEVMEKLESGVHADIKKSAYEEKLLEKLTKREKEILLMLANGFENSEISDKLNISVRTVETHRFNLMKKLEVNSFNKLIKFVVDNKILQG